MPLLDTNLLDGNGLSMPGAVWRFLERFTTDRASGAINGTPAEPGVGDRSAIDTESLLSISGDKAIFSGGRASPGFGDPGLWLPGIIRSTGQIVAFEVNPYFLEDGKACEIGLDTGQSGSTSAAFGINGETNVRIRLGGSYIVVDNALTAGERYIGFIVMRSVGYDFLLYGGTQYPHPILVYMARSGTDTTLYPALSNYNAAFSADFVIALRNLWLPVPAASDGFSSWGTTDGLGHIDNTGIGAGGNGYAWTNRNGIWTATGGVARASALSGLTQAIATISLGLPAADAWIAVELVTYVAGNIGVLTRYTSTNEHCKIYYNGASIIISDMVAGAATTILAQAVTFVSGARLQIMTIDTTIRVWYNDAYIGTAEMSTAPINGIKGIYTTNVGNTIDNYQVALRGTSNEYAYLAMVVEPYLKPLRGLHCIGDSKTNALSGDYWPKLIVGYLNAADADHSWHEVLPRNGWGGSTAETNKPLTLAQLDIITEAANIVTLNLGTNDSNSLPAEVDFKADYSDIIDAVLAKWPDCNVYCATPYRAEQAANCLIIRTWIEEIVAGYEDQVHIGPDENVWLENGDGGTTYTLDGTHYNALAQPVCASQWMTAFGY